MSAIPIIDIAPLVNGSPEQAQAVAKALGTACRDVGFFYIAGHGVPPELMARVFKTSAAFFGGPAAIRESATFTGPGNNRGYIRLGGEALDPSKPADVKEAFNIGLELAPDDPELLARAPFRGANLWPEMPGFRDTMLDYFNRVWRLGRDLHRGFALDLGLAPDFFESRLDKPIATLRLLHYPPVKAALSDGQLGAGVHTDYGNVTLLATDAVGGLMVQDRSGRWLDAPVVPNTFVCNIGDCLMRWSNDVYVSTPHKVVSPPGADRYSVAFFLDPNPDAMVACLPTCISSDRPARYAPITGADFLRSRLEPTYAAKTA
jgi:isopenicillin N synthase-like dioxygenase